MGCEPAAGWRHIAAVQAAGRLEPYVDGRPVARSDAFHPDEFNPTSEQPLRLGFDANDYLCGRLRDVRLYRGALTAADSQPTCRRRRCAKPVNSLTPPASHG